MLANEAKLSLSFLEDGDKGKNLLEYFLYWRKLWTFLAQTHGLRGGRSGDACQRGSLCVFWVPLVRVRASTCLSRTKN